MSYLLNDGSIVEEKPSLQTRKSYLRPIIKCDPKSIVHPTVQDAKNECDINNIMKRFLKNGASALTDLIRQDPTYGDFSSLPEFVDAMNLINHAHDQFSHLSARVRARFDNDPAKFLEFANDPSNGKEMVELGLATIPMPIPTPEPQKVVIVNPEANTASKKAESK